MSRLRLLSSCGVLLAAALLALSGCGAAGVSPVSPGESSRPDTSTGMSGATPPIPGVPTVSPTTPPTSGGKDASALPPSSSERMVVRSGYMEIVVDDVTAAGRAVEGLAGTFGGYVVSSSVYEDNGRTFGDVVIRVDATRFDSALGAIRALASEVAVETTSSSDVTEEYVDLSARKSNLEKTEQQLLALMEKAGTVEDLLNVQLEVGRVRGEIEQIEGRIRYLEQTAAMSLIEVSIRETVLTVSFSADSRSVDEGEPVKFTAEVSGGFMPYTYSWEFGDGASSNEASPTHSYRDDGLYSVQLTVTDDHSASTSQYRDSYVRVAAVWSPGDVFRDALAGLSSFGRGLLSIAIWFVVYIPVWLVLGGIAYLVYRRAMRKQRNKTDSH